MNVPITCSVQDATKLSGLSRSYLYELIAADRIITKKLGRRRLVLVSSLRDFLEHGGQ
ncbi:MAG: helix-turn-helix domain-containing protein [Alphaproteobacteria bacterium]|nr:helix-turn-helix domain-containing protein [Alphaproteobacteria bacterium]